MFKKFFASSVLFICLISSSVFAYKWVQYGDDWYVLNESTNVFLTSVLFDAGSGVYYLKEDGKMVTGWWKDPNNGKYYFFDNRQGSAYGAMIFGLRMIDGFYYYFNTDGSLATSKKLYELEPVYGGYYADYDGYLYANNNLLRDISLEKSEFYTNPAYYYDPNMNNLTLSNIIGQVKTDVNSLANAQVINKAVNEGTNTTNPYNTVTNVSGGTNYYFDEYGRIRNDEKQKPLSELEMYGPPSGSTVE